MKRLLILLFGILLLPVLTVAWFLNEPRPEDTTASRVYEEDPFAVNYCDLTELDGSGLTADEIPKAYTPECGIRQWPAPILAGCTEPLPEGAADLRGLWQAESGQTGHVELIEQCGNRVIVLGRSFIHDFRTTGRLQEGANDINPRYCTRVRASVSWQANEAGSRLSFKPWGLVPLVTRYLDGEDTLIWEYLNAPDSRLKRICRLPQQATHFAAGGRAQAADKL